MKFKSMVLACLILGATYAQVAQGQTFEAWKVDIQTDDFEGEVKPTLTADVLSGEGQKIGTMSIGYFVAPKGRFNSALVSFYIKGLDPTFPACDYEFLKYKIDSAESQYFPTRGYACPSLEVKSNMAAKLSAGQSLRLSASGKTGVVSLKGFKEAWVYTLSKLKRNANLSPQARRP